MKYGLPYKGSKNKIAGKIFDLFPQADNFYDLFCGGGALTHYALLQKKFKHFYMNDINPMCTQLFIDSIHGKYHNEKRWVSREDFEKLKNSDPYVAFCWSFGNNLREYLYSKTKEEDKRMWHNAIVFDQYKEFEKRYGVDLSSIYKLPTRRDKYLASKKIIKQKYSERFELQSIESLERLENMERLQSLENLENLENLETLATSYSNVNIKPNSVIYCDIPYKNTNAYGNKKDNLGFDFEAFYDWALRQIEPIFISSYEMPSDFIPIASFEHTSSISATATNKVIEKVFVPKNQFKGLHK